MSELTEVALQEAIRSVSSRVEPVTLEEVARRAASDIGATDDLTSTHAVGYESLIHRLPKRLIVAAGAAALIVAGLFYLSDSDENRLETVEDPANTTSIPREPRPEIGLTAEDEQAMRTVAGFAQALENADPVAAQALVADAPQSIKLGFWGDSIAEQLEFWEIAGAKVVLMECEPLLRGFIQCLFSVDDSVTRAQGIEPLEVSATFKAVDGAIDIANFDLAELADWTLEGWAPYVEWAEENRPEDYAVVYPQGFERSVAPSDPEVRALNASLISDFARSLVRDQLTETQP